MNPHSLFENPENSGRSWTHLVLLDTKFVGEERCQQIIKIRHGMREGNYYSQPLLHDHCVQIA